MLRNSAARLWPGVMAEQAGPLVLRWTAARPGAVSFLWPAAPHWVTRYLGQLMSAHTLSLSAPTLSLSPPTRRL